MMIWGHYHRSINEEQSNWIVEEMDHRQGSSLNASMIQNNQVDDHWDNNDEDWSGGFCQLKMKIV